MSLIGHLSVTILATFAWLVWLSRTSLLDHVTHLITFRKFFNLSELKEKIVDFTAGRLFVELLECPWCLSFHISLWVNILTLYFTNPAFFLTHSAIFDVLLLTSATAGGAMVLFSKTR